MSTLTDSQKLGLLITALDSRSLFSNPNVLASAADEIDCGAQCETLSYEHDTNYAACRKSEAGDYCANDLAETLRELAAVARQLAATKTSL